MVQSAMLCHVIGEGHHDETVSSLLRWCALTTEAGKAGVPEGAILRLLIAGTLCIEGGKVVPFRRAQLSQQDVLAHVVFDDHHEETIFELSKALSPNCMGGSVEIGVRELVRAGLLSIQKGKVTLGPVASCALADGSHA